jgi:hypothetical protein
MQDQMPPVAKFSLPSAKQGQSQTDQVSSDMPPVAKFSLPNQSTTDNGGQKKFDAGGFWNDVGNFLFPIVGDVYHDIKGTSKKSFLQQAGDTALSVLPFIPGLGEFGEAGRVAKLGVEGAKALEGGADVAKAVSTGSKFIKGAKLGYGVGVASNLSQGKGIGESINPLNTTNLLSTATGGLTSKAGDWITKLGDILPQRIVRQFLPGINEDTAKYAVTKGLGSPEKMLEESTARIKELGSSLGAKLKNPALTYIQPNGNEILQNVADKFPKSGLTAQDIANEIKKSAKLNQTTVDDMVNGNVSLEDLHKLNSNIGENIFKTKLDSPEVKAGKDIANEFYHQISSVLKTSAPESASDFTDLAREYPLNAALKKAIQAGQKSKTFSLQDLLAIYEGFKTAGLTGAGVGLAGEKALVNPTVNLKTAGLISKVSNPVTRAMGNYAQVPLIRGAQNINGLINTK